MYVIFLNIKLMILFRAKLITDVLLFIYFARLNLLNFCLEYLIIY